MKNNKQKTCLVTGANSGLGKEIALGLAQAGAHVIMVCRDLEKGQAALEEIKTLSGSASIDLLIADLSSQADIRALAKIIYQNYSTLDILINNAGSVNSKKILSIEGIEMTLATNYLGPWLLTNLLCDLLKQNAPARIINISSAIHKWARIDLMDLQYQRRKYQFMKAYAQSKLLMTISSAELARRLEGSGVTVNCVHPGAVKTGLGSASAHNFALKLIDKMIKFFFIRPKQAAKPVLDLALAPQWENSSGQYFEKGRPVKAARMTYDPIRAKQVWASTEKMLH